jgi:hypothetical protein
MMEADLKASFLAQRLLSGMLETVHGRLYLWPIILRTSHTKDDVQGASGTIAGEWFRRLPSPLLFAHLPSELLFWFDLLP